MKCLYIIESRQPDGKSVSRTIDWDVTESDVQFIVTMIQSRKETNIVVHRYEISSVNTTIIPDNFKVKIFDE